jgi:phosphoribosylglycinamide formyltransferase-1
MARLAVMASGEGSNFEALVRALRADPASRHDCAILVYDRKSARAAERARALGIQSRYVRYAGRPREAAEGEIAAILDSAQVELVALAGFMRLLSESFVESRPGKIVNVPAWPGLESIRRAFEAGEMKFGVTVHVVDSGLDTGPVLVQESFTAAPGSTLDEIRSRVHEMEHALYPKVVIDLLDGLETVKDGS